MSPYRIMLADDHVPLRQGLRSIAEKARGLEVIGEAGDGVELNRLMEGTTPDMVVLDPAMPGLRGIEAISEIKARHPKIKVLALTMRRDKEYLYQALQAGADGYLLKEGCDAELFPAIKKIRSGALYASSCFSKELADFRLLRQGYAVPVRDDECLTAREKEVLKLIAEGKSSREAAEILNISARTVEHHRANIMEKLGLGKTAELVKFAIHKGYI